MTTLIINKMLMSPELKLILIAILCALLSIVGHLILSSLFSGAYWLEITAAIIPLSFLFIVFFSFRFAQKNDQR
ncbi:hypothetical protein [Aliivibrio fischeri]|uniref:hypothetical protein n=1 Tax=Aliivibrio fischeri TaxID=668 RepID=UPI000A57F23D|nr:hypothetical protein [Aliivibrio fischeri]